MKFLKEKKYVIVVVLVICFIVSGCSGEMVNKKDTSLDLNLSGVDTDGDSISDEDEFNVYKTDPYKADSDDDGVMDNIEIELGTSLLNSDTDGDGLYDGKACYVNGKKVLPKDPEPLIYNGLKGVWKKQLEVENKQNIPYYLTTFYEYSVDGNLINEINDINWNELVKSNNFFGEVLKLPVLKKLASRILMFRLDNQGTVLHSQTNDDIYNYMMEEAKKNLSSDKYVIFESAIKYSGIKDNLETWQKQFGFNTLYDEVFRIATNNNMRSMQLYFEDSSGADYVLWLWRGYYLALGSGAEMGLYKKNVSNSQLVDLNLEHWDAIDFEVAMTLSLYNYYSENNIEHIFSWAPSNEQWWITGFNPNYMNVDVSKQVLVGMIDFSKHKDMYNSLKKQEVNNKLRDFVIFDDDDFIVWINWYEK